MTNKKALKRTLVLSIISIVICLSMFAGTTYAWFTDTASNTGNRIISGTLKVDLLKYDPDQRSYYSIKNRSGNIFGKDSSATANADETDTLWEPGKTQVVYLGIRNLGKLALKYNVWINVKNVAGAPSMVRDGYSALEYAIVDGVTASDPNFGYENLPELDWTTVKTAASTAASADAAQVGDVTIGQIQAGSNGVLDEIVNGEQDETDYFALVVHMKEDAGNDFQEAEVDIDVYVVAGQKTAEEDSFNDQYDADAIYDQIPSVSALIFADGSNDKVVTGVSDDFTGDTLIITDGVTAIAPGAFADNDTIKTISLPESIVEIGDGAFADMDALTDITLRGDVTIGSRAFVFSTIEKETNRPITYTFEGNATIDGLAFQTNYSSSNGSKIVFEGDVTFIPDPTYGYCFVFANTGIIEFRNGGKVIMPALTFYGTTSTLKFYEMPGEGSVIENFYDSESNVKIEVCNLAAWTAAGYPETFNGNTVTELH